MLSELCHIRDVLGKGVYCHEKIPNAVIKEGKVKRTVKKTFKIIDWRIASILHII